MVLNKECLGSVGAFLVIPVAGGDGGMVAISLWWQEPRMLDALPRKAWSYPKCRECSRGDMLPHDQLDFRDFRE